MNQLYHPQYTGELFKLLAEFPDVPVFTITNNVVDDLTTFEPGTKNKSRVGIERFMASNRWDLPPSNRCLCLHCTLTRSGVCLVLDLTNHCFHSLSGEFLKTLAFAHYEGKHNPPRKAFDFYTAIALAFFLQGVADGNAALRSSMTAERRVRRLFFSDEYGLTFVSVDHTWDATLERYISNIDTKVDSSDNPFVKTKKEYFYKEIHIMRNIPLLPSLKASCVICLPSSSPVWAAPLSCPIAPE
jgi:hypothetical protein